MESTPLPTDRGLSSVDFLFSSGISQAERPDHLCAKLSSILEQLETYHTVMGANGSIARHFSLPLLNTRIEARVEGLFSTARPNCVEQFQVGGVSRPSPDWLDLIREDIPKGQFEVCGDDMYHCRTPGFTIKISRCDLDILSSGVPLKLLQAPPYPEDIQTEREVRVQMILDLVLLQEGASKCE